MNYLIDIEFPGVIKFQQNRGIGFEAKFTVAGSEDGAAKAPSVLLLNDRIAPGWTVSVDQMPAKLLRCNFIMRGVFLSPGEHVVEFKFQPPLWTLYVSLAGCLALIILSVYLLTFSRASSPKQF